MSIKERFGYKVDSKDAVEILKTYAKNLAENKA